MAALGDSSIMGPISVRSRQGKQLFPNCHYVLHCQFLCQLADLDLQDSIRIGCGQHWRDGSLLGDIRQCGDGSTCGGFAGVGVVPRHGRIGVPDNRFHDRKRRICGPTQADEGVTEGVESDFHDRAFAGGTLRSTPRRDDRAVVRGVPDRNGGGPPAPVNDSQFGNGGPPSPGANQPKRLLVPTSPSPGGGKNRTVLNPETIPLLPRPLRERAG